MKLIKLYSVPKTFEPIFFESGINLILGDKDTSSNKRNGVGKSLSIEFINFALLQDFKRSRVSKIPKEAFSEEVNVCLDLIIGKDKVTIKRNFKNDSHPIIIVNETVSNFSCVSDATEYLKKILFKQGNNLKRPSFRGVLSPLIRDEGSEFKNILDSVDTKYKFSPDLKPHLYLMGIDPKFYDEAKVFQKEIDVLKKSKNKIKKDIEILTSKKFSVAKSQLNELKKDVGEIKKEIDSLASTKTFEIVQDDIMVLENSLKEDRSKLAILKSEVSQIKLFKGDNYIDEEEVESLYNSFKLGLGSKIKKEINEVKEFKKTIDSFQKSLLDERIYEILNEIEELRERIFITDDKYKSNLKALKEKGALENLKKVIAIYNMKFEEQSKLASFVDKYDEEERSIKLKKQKRSASILKLDTIILGESVRLEKFESKILDIHQEVMGNSQCSFKLSTTEKNEVVSFDMRIHDDGSRSVNREKVFIYDLSLLLADEKNEFHPGFLIHDNIFDVDQDTLIKSLNYLDKKSDELNHYQYILTINSDKISESEKEILTLDINKYTRAKFTKSNRFLKLQYQET